MPFDRFTEALDQIEPAEIYLATVGALRCAAWGEILTAAARVRGGVGALIDGFHKDTPKVIEQSWPVFSRGCYAQDAAVRAAVTDSRCPIEVGGVSIHPGGLAFGELDGVVMIPHQLEVEVIEKALEKARGEKPARAEIEAGSSS